MNRQKVVLSLLLIGSDIGALYSLAHTRSVWSFFLLTTVMIIAVMATVDWYTNADVPPSLLADMPPPAPSEQTSG
jgi:hypothetical protein